MSTAGDPVFPFLAEVLSGGTADVYFERTHDVLAALHMNPMVGVDVFAGRNGLCCGVTQVAQLLRGAGFDGELWSVNEAAAVARGEVAMQIVGAYQSFGIYETAILGILSSCSGWCTAADEVVAAAEGTPVVSFGARHAHPNVAGVMDFAAVQGGCATCSTSLGALLAGTEPSGTMPHALVLIVGDTVEAARAFDSLVPADIPRIVLVDTFQDEAVESVRVARALAGALQGIRLDTPRERGGVTPSLVTEVRARLDQEGFEKVEIFVSGGITPDRIRAFHSVGSPVDGYGVGSYISGAAPIDYTADIREIEGRPVAKRGRVPGMQRRDGLHRLL